MTLAEPFTPTHITDIEFRSARPADGAALWRLVQASGTLELNSAYFYLLFATDFGDTCLVADLKGEVMGAVIGYHPPRQPHTAFVWQVGILPAYRGQGLGPVLLRRWLELPANRQCHWVTATVAADNAPSLALFQSFARAQGTQLHTQALFTPGMFPHEHPAEPLLRIGPIASPPP